jgi:hypothetical protein
MIHPLANWVEMVAKNNPEITLAQLTGMGSHDAGTYTISTFKCCSGVSRTQSIDLYGQFKAGSRLVDYRYGPVNLSDPQALVVQHGIHLGTDYYKELEGVTRFLEENPHEFINLDINFERKITNEQKKYLIEYLVRHFGHLAIKEEDINTWAPNFPHVALSEILRRPGKRVFIVVDRNLYTYENDPGTIVEPKWLRERGLFKRDDYIESRWWDVPDPVKLIKSNHDYINERPNRNRLMVAQYILTPQSTTKDIVKFVFGLERLRVDQNTYLLHRDQSLSFAIRESAHLPNANLFLMDFIHYEPYITHYLIGLNFKDKLTIHKAVCTSRRENIDVTDKVRALVRRENSMWIINFAKDLGLKRSSGTFMIAFTMQTRVEGKTNPADTILTEFFEYESDSQYLLNSLRGKLDKALPLSAFTNDYEELRRHADNVTMQEFLKKCSAIIDPTDRALIE